MQGDPPVRTRPVIDKVVLIFVAACLGIAVVRLATVAVTVPYVAYTNHREAVADKATGITPTATLLGTLKTNQIAIAWWGLRPVPYPGGGDYLAVVSFHQPERTLGSVIGVVAEQNRKLGVPFNRVIVPFNRTLLYGETAGLLVQSADGSMDRTTWRSLAADAAAFSDVPVVRKKYNPVVTAAQKSAIRAKTRLSLRSNDFYVGTSRAGDSGTWILRVRVGPSDRQYLLVPLESSPLGGAK